MTKPVKINFDHVLALVIDAFIETSMDSFIDLEEDGESTVAESIKDLREVFANCTTITQLIGLVEDLGFDANDAAELVVNIIIANPCE